MPASLLAFFTFGVQTAKGKNGSNAGGGGISKEDMERLIAAAKETAPAQTIRIEQAPIKISTDDTYKNVIPCRKLLTY